MNAPVTQATSQIENPSSSSRQLKSSAGAVAFGFLVWVSLLLNVEPVHGDGSSNSAGGARPPSKKLSKEKFLDKKANREVEIVQGEVLIRFKKALGDQEANTALGALGGQTRGKSKQLGFYRHKVPPGLTVEKFIEKHSQDPGVELIEPNFIAGTHGKQTSSPDDPLLSSQWAISTIHADSSWKVTIGSPNTIVAIVDSGIDSSHPDLSGQLVAGYDFVNDDADPSDDNGHGTHVGGIVAAKGNNGIGIAGVAWGCRLMPVKVVNALGEGTYADVIEGITYAADHGARVINLSIGGYAYSQLLADAVQYAHDKGIVLVAAAGNDGSDTPVYPAACPDVIAISATDPSDKIWPLSNHGSHIRLSAPGSQIVSATLNHGYAAESGTSASAAFASAIAALLLSNNSDLSNTELVQILCKTADDLGAKGRDQTFGYGRINAVKSVKVSNIKVHDVAIVGIATDPQEPKVGEPTRILVTVENKGTFEEKNVELQAFINSSAIGAPQKIQKLGLREPVEITLDWVPLLNDPSTNSILKAVISPVRHEENTANNEKQILFRYDDDAGVFVLYKNRPFVHSWVALQAYSILPSGSLKSEVGTYLYNGQSEYSTLFGSAKIWEDQYTVPSGWSSNRKSGASIMEGAWEEDADNYLGVPGDAPLRHFWEPDRGYSYGLWINACYLGSAFRSDSNLSQAQYWWSQALDYYASDRGLAYYFLGRVIHLLGDLGVPEHVHCDQHPGNSLGICTDKDDYSNYEQFTMLYYREYTGSGSPKDISALPLAFPNYADAPSVSDAELGRLFYNQAQYTQHFDAGHDSASQREDGVAKDYNGNNKGYGGSTINMGISLENGSANMAYPAVDYLGEDGGGCSLAGIGDGDSNNGIDPGASVSIVWQKYNFGYFDYRTIFEGPGSGVNSTNYVDLARGKGQIMYPSSLWVLMNNTLDRLKITYTYRGTTCTYYSSNPRDTGSYYAVPDRKADGQMATLFPENFRYVAALYQLFWTRTHGSIKVTTSPTSARWKVDGGSWHNSGDTVSDLAIGDHTVSFETISCYTAPTDQTVTVTAGATKTTSGTYTRISYSITTSSNPTNGGTTSGGGTKNCGDSATVLATANTGYVFTNWTEGGTQVSAVSNYTFQVDSDRDLVANFSQQSHTLTVASLNPDSGVQITVSPPDKDGDSDGPTQFSRTYSHNTVVTLTAPSSASGNYFQKWRRGGSDYSTSRTTNVTMGANYTMTAVYTNPPCSKLSSPNPSFPACGGTVSNNTPTLMWNNVANETGYVIEVFSAGICSGAAIHTSSQLAANTTSYEVPESANLQNGQTYSWQVKAIGDDSAYCDSDPSSCCAFTVNMPQQPVISRNPPSLTNTVSLGQNATNQGFQVWNSGVGTLDYAIQTNVTWLSVSPPGGSSTSQTNFHTVQFHTEGLPVGTNNGLITVAATGAESSPQTVAVTLIVKPSQILDSRTILVANVLDHQIIAVDPVTGTQSVFASGGYLVGPAGITVESSGSVVVTDTALPPKIIRIDPTTGIQTVVTSSGKLSSPRGIITDQSGNLLVANMGDGTAGSVVRVDPATGVQALLATNGSLVNTFGIALDHEERILVADPDAYGGGGGIIRIDPLSGNQTGVSSNGYFNETDGIAVETDGNLVVTDSRGSSASSVIRVNPITGEQSVISQGDLLYKPIAIAIDANGDLLVLDGKRGGSGSSKIIRIDPVTGEQTIVSSNGLLSDSPEGIAIMSAGRPEACFIAAPTNGTTPLTVVFDSGCSTGIITNRFWSFGDGGMTNTTNASVPHSYLTTGTYTVALVVSGPGGSNTQTRSNCIVVVSPPPPLAPSDLSVTSFSFNQINLHWTDNSTNEDGFRVEYKTGSSGDWTLIATVAANIKQYRNTGLIPSTTYYYRVSSFNSAGSAASAEVGVATPSLDSTVVIGWGDNLYGEAVGPNGLSNVVAVTAGGNHSLALLGDQSVVAWGANFYGERVVPSGLSNVTAVAAGEFHNLAVTRGGTVVQWGGTNYGQAVPPIGLSNVTAIAGGNFHSLALKANGTIVGWGNNGYGQTVAPVGLSNVVAIAAGGYHSLALKSDGRVVGFGWNRDGQISIPVGLSNVVAIAAGSMSSFALKSDGIIVGWGNSSYGELNLPVGISNVVAIATGDAHGLALKSDETVVSWGWNQYGQTNTPSGLSNVVAIAAGAVHSLALVKGTAPIATFSAAPTAGVTPLTVTFTDSSAGTITNRSWSFGNGITNTLATNVVRNYLTAGTNDVTLTVSGPLGSSSKTIVNYVVVFGLPSTPAGVSATDGAYVDKVNVSWQTVAGVSGYSVWRSTVNDTNATEQLFVVGGSVTNANDESVLPGTNYFYWIRSRIILGTNLVQSSFSTPDMGYAAATVPPPVANFTPSDVVTGQVPLPVNFNDLSSGAITNRRWSFGDGTTTNFTSATNPSHTYTNAGVFPVTLTVFGLGGSNTLTRNNLITVTNAPSPQPEICLTPVTLTNTVLEGQNGSNQTFEVWNCGEGTLDYAISDNVPWLTVSPTNGTSTGEANLHTVIYNTSGLPIGTTNATITITGNADNTPQLIQVTLVVTKVCTLSEALDNTSLTWSNTTWECQDMITHDGVDAAISGEIGNNQSSTFSTVVQGPGIINFWWRVSSQLNGDFLGFSINGVQQTSISGDVDWNALSFPIPAGSHTLEWTYAKDTSDLQGENAGFVDQVQWEAVPPCPDLSGVWGAVKSKCKDKKGVLTCKLSGKLEVPNSGDAEAGETIVRFYLSNDATFDGGDTLIGENTVKALALGKTGKAKLKAQLIDNNPSGKYLIAVIDADEDVTECDESNNIAVTDPLP